MSIVKKLKAMLSCNEETSTLRKEYENDYYKYSMFACGGQQYNE
jgi:hypothetical protein